LILLEVFGFVKEFRSSGSDPERSEGKEGSQGKGCGERDAVLCPAQHTAARSAFVALRLASLPHRVPFRLDAVRIVNQPVEDVVG
jgi:hypothetical protein